MLNLVCSRKDKAWQFELCHVGSCGSSLPSMNSHDRYNPKVKLCDINRGSYVQV